MMPAAQPVARGRREQTKTKNAEGRFRQNGLRYDKRERHDDVAGERGYDDNDNKDTKSFMWYATADSILEKLNRLCELISGTID
jgi:hypothetical protein